MVWPDQPYSREFLVAASECDFERLPTVMREELELHAQCPKTTCDVENSFREPRDQERHHTASKLGKFARWHHAAHDTVLPDMDWLRLEPTLADRSNAAYAPKAAATDFVAWKARELAPEEIFEQFMGERTWAVPSLENFFKTAQATHTGIAFKEDFSWIERGFLCFLMVPRASAMQPRTPKAKGSVLGTVDQGVDVWAARAAQAANHFGVAMEPVDKKNMCSQVFTWTTPSGWRWKVLPPRRASGDQVSQSRSEAIAWASMRWRSFAPSRRRCFPRLRSECSTC
jgi:hypothetical protein